MVAVIFNNGSAQLDVRRCEHCNCEFQLNRQQDIQIIECGWTAEEKRCEARRIAAAHVMYAIMDTHNAPEHWYLPHITSI